ncbi:serine hydrolase domain-containing protein [Aciditerrimonas ferrireducens]|uniref:Serine hydrolase domain-containing protein n=1 Tax=Aciditerrimonas ferrireducens TaxID=667306 RepID=A0ABV6C5W7_9ACTN
MSATTLAPEDPDRLGFDPARLARLGRLLDAYVAEGRLPGWQLLVARHGRLAYAGRGGHRDVEAGLPVEDDTIFRIYSMTKPLTSVAVMSLVEEGRLELADPVARYLPAFAQPRVYRGGPSTAPFTVPATEPIRVWHLLTHTAGLSYGFHDHHPVDVMYQRAGFAWGSPRDVDAQGAAARFAELPLLFEPGTSWTYSVATDVLGALVEVVSGQTLDRFLAERVTGPLGMVDTAFAVPAEHQGRVAALYSPGPGGRIARVASAQVPTEPPTFLSGGGGLLGTAADYLRFCEAIRLGGALEGTRLLAPRTVELMGANHLPGGADLESFGERLYAESPFTGTGFGLGFAVLLDPAQAKSFGSPGELSWGGAASTAFWVDRALGISVVFCTQLLPSNTLPVRSQLRTLVYQALLEP